MKMIPKYAKIMTLGASRTENALIGDVVIQEKVDGSQFRVGLNEDNELFCGSKNVNWEYNKPEGMFAKGYDYIFSLEEVIKNNYEKNTFFFFEYLEKPKHNVLAYDEIPRNYLVLFDVLINGEWVKERKTLENIADHLLVSVVPELFRGIVENGFEFIKDLVETTDSFLGGNKIEGCVIKNYEQNIEVGNNIFPLFTKYVRAEFKEKHSKGWKNKGSNLEEYYQTFANENRWLKAIQRFKEAGILQNSPKDIGLLIEDIKVDIFAEETDNIKDFLFNHFKRNITRVCVRGFPEWYKDYLAKENLTKVEK